MPPKRKPSNSMDGALSPSAILNEVGGPSHSQVHKVFLLGTQFCFMK